MNEGLDALFVYPINVNSVQHRDVIEISVQAGTTSAFRQAFGKEEYKREEAEEDEEGEVKEHESLSEPTFMQSSRPCE
jgi:hypothetical protein